MNFTSWTLDSLDEDPVYGTYTHWGHTPDEILANTYYVRDSPHPHSFDSGTKGDMQFRTGIYCIKGVPEADAVNQPYVGIPFEESTWVYRLPLPMTLTET